MKEWLNKEYVVKRKRGGIVLEVILDSIILSLVFYILLTQCGSVFISFFNEIVRNDLILDMVLILFPITLVIVALVKTGFYIAYANRSEPVKINIKKSNKTTKKSKKRS